MIKRSKSENHYIPHIYNDKTAYLLLSGKIESIQRLFLSLQQSNVNEFKEMAKDSVKLVDALNKYIKCKKSPHLCFENIFKVPYDEHPLLSGKTLKSVLNQLDSTYAIGTLSSDFDNKLQYFCRWRYRMRSFFSCAIAYIYLSALEVFLLKFKYSIVSGNTYSTRPVTPSVNIRLIKKFIRDYNTAFDMLGCHCPVTFINETGIQGFTSDQQGMYQTINFGRCDMSYAKYKVYIVYGNLEFFKKLTGVGKSVTAYEGTVSRNDDSTTVNDTSILDIKADDAEGVYMHISNTTAYIYLNDSDDYIQSVQQQLFTDASKKYEELHKNNKAFKLRYSIDSKQLSTGINKSTGVLKDFFETGISNDNSQNSSGKLANVVQKVVKSNNNSSTGLADVVRKAVTKNAFSFFESFKYFSYSLIASERNSSQPAFLFNVYVTRPNFEKYMDFVKHNKVINPSTPLNHDSEPSDYETGKILIHSYVITNKSTNFLVSLTQPDTRADLDKKRNYSMFVQGEIDVLLEMVSNHIITTTQWPSMTNETANIAGSRFKSKVLIDLAQIGAKESSLKLIDDTQYYIYCNSAKLFEKFDTLFPVDSNHATRQ